jgi:hypothetical protein
MTIFATCGGSPVERATIHVPYQGPWYADVVWLDDAPDVGSGSVTLVIGAVSFVGTIDPHHAGVFGDKRTARLVAGANGWQQSIAARGYANDAGIKASTVAGDAANAVGETIGSFAGGVDRLGAHYTRDSGPASRTIEDAAKGVPWWVDYSGNTQVGTRPSTPATGTYTVLSFDPKQNLAVLSVDAVDTIVIGSAIVDAQRLPTPVTVRSLEICVASDSLRVRVWCGVSGENFFAQAMRAIHARLSDQRLTGKFRYRVVNQTGTTVDLQWVKRANSLTIPPDMLRVSMVPGVAGAHNELQNGAIVYCEFVDGMRDDPIITGFEGRGNPAAIPTKLQLGGPNGFSGVARQNDTVSSPLPPMVVNGTITIGGTPSPFTGVLMAATGTVLGSITTCSDNVQAGNS